MKKKLNKKASAMMMVLIIVAGVVIGGGALIGLGAVTGLVSLDKLSIADDGNPEDTPTAKADFCSNNAKLDLAIRGKDTLATSSAYLNFTFYLEDIKTGSIVEKTIDLSTGDYDTHADTLVCGNDGYNIYVKTTQDGYNAIEEPVKIDKADLYQDPVYVDFGGSKHTLLKVKAYDNANKAKLTNDSVGVSTDYVILGDTATFNGSGMTVGTDGYIDVTFTLAPNSANEAGGKEAILCVDYSDSSNTDDWDGDSIDIAFENNALTEFNLNSNDASALSDYEICYALPHPVGKSASGNYDSVSTVDFYISSQSGVNPDDDLVLRYVELGDYKDDDVESMLEGVAARTDSSRTLMGSASTSTITLDIDNS